MAKPFEHATIHLYNNTGQSVKHIENISGNTYSLQLIDLPSGIYHLVMAENGKTVGYGEVVVE
ncbi:MAG: T9SS type A sorting domain-containing protein [Flavobacteriales bacterium]|nr:T9SS type A sorting domain-containing protein [Flavobacteriales bacterium]